MSGARRLTLEWLSGRYAVCRLSDRDSLPGWVAQASAGVFSCSQEHDNKAKQVNAAPLVCVTRTDRELSIVVDESIVPEDVQAERGFVAMRIAGTLDFSAVGILSSLTGALAAAKVPALAISTYDTDVLLVAAAHQQRAVEALKRVANIV
ncbi:MAG: ACT domain-containing protein [Phycisphaerales bacterium]|nr:ACT domain-containing protein [Phycisphaerales bacterium]